MTDEKTIKGIARDVNITPLYSDKINNLRIILCPLQDVIDNQLVKSNYKRWFNDPTVTALNSHGLFPFNPINGVQEYINAPSRIVWGIVELSYPEQLTHIGNVALDKIDLLHKSAEFTCVIGEVDYWGKGIMSWCLKCICNHGFRKVGLNRIWSGTSEHNIGMQRCFDKAGFVKEGVFREGMFNNGVFVDIYSYGLLRTPTVEYNAETAPITQDTPEVVPPPPESKEIIQDRMIDNIEDIRKGNNRNWMDLVRIALLANPERAKEVLRLIVEQDEKIKNVLAGLIEL